METIVITLVVLGVVAYLGFLTTLKNSAEALNKGMDYGNSRVDELLNQMEVKATVNDAKVWNKLDAKVSDMDAFHTSKSVKAKLKAKSKVAVDSAKEAKTA